MYRSSPDCILPNAYQAGDETNSGQARYDKWGGGGGGGGVAVRFRSDPIRKVEAL